MHMKCCGSHPTLVHADTADGVSLVVAAGRSPLYSNAEHVLFEA